MMSESTGERIFGVGANAAWTPDEATLRRSRLLRFMDRLGLGSIAELHREAVSDPDRYWDLVVRDLGLRFEQPYVSVSDQSHGKEFSRWFVGGTINVSANCSDRFASGADGEKDAIVWEDEDGAVARLTYRELHGQVVNLARYLRDVGVQKGDRIGLYMPMIPEAAVAFLAAARIGAVLVPAFSGYGPDALASRLSASRAKVLITADSYVRKGKRVAMREVAARAVDRAPSVDRVIVVENGDGPQPLTPDREVAWNSAMAAGEGSTTTDACTWVDPNDPLMIVYTSGTSGKPKGVVHSHGGFLTKVGHDLGYCMDIQADDVVCWVADLGWIIGPLVIIGATMFHCTAVYLTGAPDQPNPGRLWSVADRHGVTVLGLSPTAVRGMMAAGDQWLNPSGLGQMRAFVTSGEPWSEDAWHWLMDTVGGGRLPIINYIGGTEIGGGILSCYTVLPMRPGAFAGPVIGMDADVVDDAGEPVRGQIGELIVRNTWPGMTNSFWEDDDRYRETYWSRWPGLWRHSDLAIVDEDGFWYVTGRADDTLKLAGKRVGPAEIESAVLTLTWVADAAAIGVPDDLKGQVLVCFAVTGDGAPDHAAAETAIKRAVADRLGRALTPDRVVFVQGLPKTRTNKIVRRAIKARYLGLPPGDLSSLESPEQLEFIPELAASIAVGSPDLTPSREEGDRVRN